MKTIEIQVYKFEELQEDIQYKIVNNLDKYLGLVPFYDDNAEISYQSHNYIYEQDKSWIIDLCDMNGYLFDVNGILYTV